ncbi:MAG: 2-hydroxychromene-2-carboxylate isomerase [Myxococcales bacterium]|nr:2-hydroxychromene-2-carboxylate isomerase [Myxococcales bacterium]
MAHIDFWFDFISPYAYFGWLRIREIAARHDATLRARPVLFAALLNHHGQLGPAEIPSKREHTFKDILRYATLNDVELTGTATHPFNPITALRCSLPEVAGSDQHTVIDAFFRAGWGRGADLGDPAALQRVLDQADLDGAALLAATREPTVKDALKGQVAAALERGVFGVPTCDVDGELFWGNDRLSYVELRLQGRDPLPDEAVERLLALPAGAVRPGARRT